jgi:hypothetical protein
MDQHTRRIIGLGVHVGNVDGPALCRMLNQATSRKNWPTYLSSENDPLFQYHRWNANLQEYQCYYNESRTHSGRDGSTPVKSGQ